MGQFIDSTHAARGTGEEENGIIDAADRIERALNSHFEIVGIDIVIFYEAMVNAIIIEIADIIFINIFCPGSGMSIIIEVEAIATTTTIHPDGVGFTVKGNVIVGIRINIFHVAAKSGCVIGKVFNAHRIYGTSGKSCHQACAAQSHFQKLLQHHVLLSDSQMSEDRGNRGNTDPGA